MDKLKSKNNLIITILKGTIISVAVSLMLILLFALLIRFFDISEKAIFPVNQGIKIISIFIGLVVALKNNKEKGLLKGLLFGAIYFILSFVVFSILQGSFQITSSNIYDFILTTLMSGILGLIVVHIGK